MTHARTTACSVSHAVARPPADAACPRAGRGLALLARGILVRGVLVLAVLVWRTPAGLVADGPAAGPPGPAAPSPPAPAAPGPGPGGAPAAPAPVARGAVVGGAQGLRPRGAALAAALRSTRLARVELEGLDLSRLLAWLRAATGWNWALDGRALAEAGIDPAQVLVSARLEDMAVGSLLELLLEPHGLALRVQDTLVWVTTRAAAEGPLLTRLYGIAHLAWAKVDFPGPRISLAPEGGGADVVPAEEVVGDDGLATGEQVLEWVQRMVEPGRWGEGGWLMRATQRDLLVRAPAAVHARVLRALAQLAAVK